MSVTNISRIETSLQNREIYELCPTDALLGGLLWIAWPLFYRSHIKWTPLLDALRHVEKSYPILCGRLETYEGNRLCVEVDYCKENGFGVVEIETSMTLSEIRRSAGMIRRKGTNTMPCMNWPFFLDTVSDHPVLIDSGSLFGVHVVRMVDGCIVNVSARHLLCDGERYVQLLADISRAYRGLEINDRHLDRSFYWPDRYLEHFSLPEQTPDMYPRHMISWMPPFDEEGLSFSCIHLPQVTIQRMKKRTVNKLTGCDFVSTHDLCAALCWMLKAEGRSNIQPVTSKNLLIRGTSLEFPINAHTTEFSIVPQNYFGNATLEAFATFDGDIKESETFTDVLARAASLVRVTINGIRTCPKQNFKSLLHYYLMVTAAEKSSDPSVICRMASYHKMGYNDIDFGNGAPCHVYTTPTFPGQKLTCALAPGPNGNGVLLYLVVSSYDKQILERSLVVAKCAPGATVFHTELQHDDVMLIMGSM